MLMNVILILWDDLRFMLTDACQISVQTVRRCIKPVLFLITILFSQTAIGEVFIGAKVGKMMVDVPASTDPDNFAMNIGYEFDTLLADLSIAGEINRTMSSGTTDLGDELEFESEAVYIIWKSTRSLFATLRGGVVQDETISGSTSLKRNGILIGASVGIVIGKTRLQVEYTSHAGHADFLGIGLEF